MLGPTSAFVYYLLASIKEIKSPFFRYQLRHRCLGISAHSTIFFCIILFARFRMFVPAPVNETVRLSVRQSFSQSISQSRCLSVRLSVFPSVQSFYQLVSLSVRSAIRPSVHHEVSLSFSLSPRPICLPFICPSVRL